MYHRYETDAGGTGIGTGADVQLTRKFGKRFTALAKYAGFRSEGPAYPNVRKFWAQVEFAY